MKKFKNHQHPGRKYRFDIVGHKKALKIWWDNPFKCCKYLFLLMYESLIIPHLCMNVLQMCSLHVDFWWRVATRGMLLIDC